MPVGIDKPIFCLTSDIDWASEACLKDHFNLIHSLGVKPTFFGTHKSSLLTDWSEQGVIDLGLHPNFLPGSTHGNERNKVIDHLFTLFPKAQSFRSHCFVDDSLICNEIYKRGINYDSNLCLYMQPGIGPLRHSSGLTRYPCFFEDDVHWDWTGGDWLLKNHLDHFMTPGLKILNFHPKFISFNVPNAAEYQKIKQHMPDANETALSQHRYNGPGPRTFMKELIQHIKNMGNSFHTLAEIHAMFSSQMKIG